MALLHIYIYIYIAEAEEKCIFCEHEISVAEISKKQSPLVGIDTGQLCYLKKKSSI